MKKLRLCGKRTEILYNLYRIRPVKDYKKNFEKRRTIIKKICENTFHQEGYFIITKISLIDWILYRLLLKNIKLTEKINCSDCLGKDKCRNRGRLF